MARDFQVNGECLVTVKGNGALGDSQSVAKLWELGLAEGPIKIVPKFIHKGMAIDDFGPDIPAEMRWMLAEVSIHMTLIHFDPSILDDCVTESMGGQSSAPQAGTFVGAGTPMGGGVKPLQKGCHYISLNLASPLLLLPWRFPTSYLAESPFEFPLSTEKSAVTLHWKAIPYAVHGSNDPTFELKSAGTVLWDRTADVA